jgi:hypothetical protein
MLKIFGETATFMLWHEIWQNNNMLLLSTIQISSYSYYRYLLHCSALLYIKLHFRSICMYMTHDRNFFLPKANWSVGTYLTAACG